MSDLSILSKMVIFVKISCFWWDLCLEDVWIQLFYLYKLNTLLETLKMRFSWKSWIWDFEFCENEIFMKFVIWRWWWCSCFQYINLLVRVYFVKIEHFDQNCHFWAKLTKLTKFDKFHVFDQLLSSRYRVWVDN